jgi:hypothetical protein
MTTLRCLLVLVPLLASHVSAQEGGPPVVVTPSLSAAAPRVGAEVNELPPQGYMGFTDCRAGVPTSRFDPTLDSITEMEVRLHEQLHRLQLAVGCDSVQALWRRDPRAAVQAEAEALCFAAKGMGFSPGALAHEAEKQGELMASSGAYRGVRLDTIAAVVEAPAPLTTQDFAYPALGYAVYSQGTILAGHGWWRA